MDAFLVDSIRIEPRTHVVSVDGELVRVAPVLEYRHLPGALRVVVA
jgi:diacylglycerol kinase family enzyme